MRKKISKQIMLTINLLPEKVKQELNQKIILATIKNITALIFIAVIFVAVILLWAKMVSVNNFNRAIEQATLISKEYGGINQEIRKLNERIDFMRETQKEYIVWSDVLKRIIILIPNDVSIHYLSISDPGKSVALKGIAKTRDGLLTFKSNLEKSSLFSNVDIPISYFLSRENINFEISLKTTKNAFR